jgi:hypothetical protein
MNVERPEQEAGAIDRSGLLSTTEERCFLRGPCRSVINETVGAMKLYPGWRRGRIPPP